jgi:hypothetical protein
MHEEDTNNDDNEIRTLPSLLSAVLVWLYTKIGIVGVKFDYSQAWNKNSKKRLGDLM